MSKLKRFASQNTPDSWKQVANEINREFRHVGNLISKILLKKISSRSLSLSLILQIDKFSTGSLFNRVYLTNSWLVKVGLYSLHVSDHDSMELVLTDSTEVSMRTNDTPSTQFLKITIKPAVSCPSKFTPFNIRLNSFEYKDFCEKIAHEVRLACDVVIKQSLPEQFLDAFKQQLALNDKYQYRRSVGN